jgi:transcriptional regulator with XRE-family HTH domain
MDFVSSLDISNAEFANQVGIPRSSLSHLQSGRNKPTLELIDKIILRYPEVDLLWILKGEKNLEVVPPSSSSEITNEISKIKDPKKSVESIVWFYSDGTFKTFNQ